MRPASCPAAALAATLQELLADDAARQAAERFGAAIAELGAGEVATTKVVDLLRRPALSRSTPRSVVARN